MTDVARIEGIERHTIYPIPAGERHGRAVDLFTVWFGSNIMILTIVTGALATLRFRLSLIAAILAILIGNLVGGIFMALHAAQGPQLGVPQMVQSRGQFGSVGAIFVVALVVVMYLGFVASNLVLGGESLHSIAAGISDHTGIVLIALLSLATAIYGYDLIHAYARWMTWVCGAALAACFFWVIAVKGLPADVWQRGGFSSSGFLGMVSVGALWQIAYAPYVSDYSRYMPADSGVRPTFWASYWGCVLGSVLPMLLGALLGLTVADGNVVAGLAIATQPISVLIVVVFSIGIGSTTAMNVYCGVLSSITVGPR
jgi:NCS1 family nucleobase:cation symporter-1